MSDIAIKVDNLGKQYRIGMMQTQYRTLRDNIVEGFQRIGRGRKGSTSTIWALRNVSFEVRQGQVLGVIGRNGAGKSTTINMMVGALTPDSGTVHIDGALDPTQPSVRARMGHSASRRWQKTSSSAWLPRA